MSFTFGIIFQKRDEIRSFKEINKEASEHYHDIPIKKIEKISKEILREFKVEGLNEIILEIGNLGRSELYKNIHDAVYLSKKKFEPGIKYFGEDTIIKEDSLRSPLQKLAFKNMRNPGHILLIHFLKFFRMYTFLNSIYYINIERKLNQKDYDNINFGGIDKRIILKLDKFDAEDEVFEVPAEFFKNLIKVNWNDKKTKDLFRKLEKLRQYSNLELFGLLNTLFNVSEKEFIIFHAGCSAVNDENDNITQKDIIKAYKTYFKLIKTDTTKYKTRNLLDNEQNRNIDRGFLVCDKCGGYYELQEGETPEDFEECQCGGKLEYTKKIG
jgi:hypothetical protein